MVTLFGEVVRSTKSRMLFSVASQLGDARNLGISGQVWLPTARVYGLAKDRTGYYRIRISYELADLVSKGCQQCD